MCLQASLALHIVLDDTISIPGCTPLGKFVVTEARVGVEIPLPRWLDRLCLPVEFELDRQVVFRAAVLASEAKGVTRWCNPPVGRFLAEGLLPSRAREAAACAKGAV